MKSKHEQPNSPEEFLQKDIFEANPNWTENAIFLIDILASANFGELTVENLIENSAEYLRGNAYAYCDSAEIDVDDDVIGSGISEIEEWLKEKGLKLGSGKKKP